MTTFVLLSKVAAASAGEMTDLVEMDELFDRELAESLPEVRRIASYALLGAYDFMHIFEAPDGCYGGQSGPAGQSIWCQLHPDPDRDPFL